MISERELAADISNTVRLALAEDIGTGDLSAALIPAVANANAKLVCREQAVLCGTSWFDETFRQLDPAVRITWHKHDGDALQAGQLVCDIQGAARALLSGERTALNFLQLLSGTASVTRQYVDLFRGTATRLLDTRKTIPGLRAAQKYAVRCGGGMNHRMGLYDAILIKENHIHAAGGIAAAVATARQTQRPVQVEVENLSELEQALAAGADHVLLDNFSLDDLQAALVCNAGRARLEASGAVEAGQLAAIASMGLDYISVGALTKHVRAVDFSMRIS